MGSKAPQKAKPTLEDVVLDMKMNSKQLARESTKAMKDSQKYMKKAKQSLKKNNEEGAKLNLQSAASKRAESMNLQRMGMKMNFIAGHMKGMENNAQIMGSFEKLNQIAGNNTPNFNVMS